MSKLDFTGNCHDISEILRDHFPYVRRGEHGELIIPAEKVEDFVRKYQDLSATKEHLEYLRLYRSGVRTKLGENDD